MNMRMILNREPTNFGTLTRFVPKANDNCDVDAHLNDVAERMLEEVKNYDIKMKRAKLHIVGTKQDMAFKDIVGGDGCE